MMGCAPGKNPPASSKPASPSEETAPKTPAPIPEQKPEEKPQTKAFSVEAVFPEGQTFLRLERTDRDKNKVSQYRLMLPLTVNRADGDFREILIESTDKIVFENPKIACPLKSSLELKSEGSAVHFSAMVPTGKENDRTCEEDFGKLVTGDFLMEFPWKRQGFDVLKLKSSIRK